MFRDYSAEPVIGSSNQIAFRPLLGETSFPAADRSEMSRRARAASIPRNGSVCKGFPAIESYGQRKFARFSKPAFAVSRANAPDICRGRKKAHRALFQGDW